MGKEGIAAIKQIWGRALSGRYLLRRRIASRTANWPLSIRYALILGGFGMLWLTAVYCVHELASGSLKRLDEARRWVSIREVLGDHPRNAAMEGADVVWVPPSPMLDRDRASRVLRLYREGVLAAAVLEPVAQGYAGAIRLLVALTPEGEILGARVSEHHETPGLGDPVDSRVSNWILGFVGHSLQDPSYDRWDVVRHGGVFDQFTGATITPRAVIKTIRETLLFWTRYEKSIREAERDATISLKP